MDPIIQIENATFGELKKDRDVFIASLDDVAASDLAARFVRARTDAKQRDEKLAEQGVTITALQESLADLRQRETGLALQVQSQEQAAVAAATDRDAMGRQLQAETRRAERLKVVASRNHGAVSASAKLLNDALTAQLIDDADKGE